MKSCLLMNLILYTFIVAEGDKWIAVPGLNPYDFPCYPGSVILTTSSGVPNFLSKKKQRAYFAGTLSDFYPSGNPFSLVL